MRSKEKAGKTLDNKKIYVYGEEIRQTNNDKAICKSYDWRYDWSWLPSNDGDKSWRMV